MKRRENPSPSKMKNWITKNRKPKEEEVTSEWNKKIIENKIK